MTTVSTASPSQSQPAGSLATPALATTALAKPALATHALATTALATNAVAPAGLAHANSAEWPERSQRLGWRILLTLLLLLLVALFSILLQSSRPAQAAAPAQAATDPLVLAFYYSWFDDNTWNSGQLSDLPAERYVSADRGAMGRHIDQAKAAGIDAFLVAWYGPGGGNQTETNLQALLEEAAARNFRIGILFETDSPFLGDAGSVGAALQHALSVHANHPAYLRADGRPVIFFWRSSLYGVGTWAGIRAQADPAYNALWVGEGVDTSQLSVFDGHYLYSNTWNPPADLTAVNQKFADRVAEMRQATGAAKLWVATAMPGYNDTGVRPNSGFARGRDDGAYYAQSWQAAIASRPNWVVVTSFNEWPEGTYIEPSAAYGDAYLGLTAQYAGQFRAGGGASFAAAEPAPAAAAASEPPASDTADQADGAGTEPATPTVFVQTAVLNLRAGPGTAYALLGAVVEGDALPILGRAAATADDYDWWQVDTVAGPAWLFGEHVAAAGPLDGVPLLTAEPAEPAEPAAVEDAAAAAPAALPTPTPTLTPTPGPTPGLKLTIDGVQITLRPAASSR
jgi:hypothetical protein